MPQMVLCRFTYWTLAGGTTLTPIAFTGHAWTSCGKCDATLRTTGTHRQEWLTF